MTFTKRLHPESLYWKSAGHILSSFKCNYLVAAGFVALWIGARFERMFRNQRCAMEHPPYASLFVYNMMIYLKKLGLALPRWFAEVCIVCLFSLWRSSLLSLLFDFPTNCWLVVVIGWCFSCNQVHLPYLGWKIQFHHIFAWLNIIYINGWCTHCGVMVSKRCEWCHSLRLISWVAWQ